MEQFLCQTLTISDTYVTIYIRQYLLYLYITRHSQTLSFICFNTWHGGADNGGIERSQRHAQHKSYSQRPHESNAGACSRS